MASILSKVLNATSILVSFIWFSKVCKGFHGKELVNEAVINTFMMHYVTGDFLIVVKDLISSIAALFFTPSKPRTSQKVVLPYNTTETKLLLG